MSSLQASADGPLYSLMVHTADHSTEDIILNRDIFSSVLTIGGYVQIVDPERVDMKVTLKVNSLQSVGGRLEISLLKTVAEALGFKPFTKVVVNSIEAENAAVDFVELVFRRQFLQRGNMWRFKKAMFGRPVYVNQNVAADGVQAQIQELGIKGKPIVSGIITEKSHVVFRSRSARLIWLVQISAEMWDYDQNGDLYFETFLHKFVNPLFDRWKALSVSHSLTVIFFARTLYLDRVDSIVAPELAAKLSLKQDSHGTWYQDHYKVVIENVADIDKTVQLKQLRKEFWSFPSTIGWNISNINRNLAYNIDLDLTKHDHDDGFLSTAGRHRVDDIYQRHVPMAVPSDAANGNFLESINTTLNLLDKHYMDRDLLRTGNSIVMVSAGTGVYTVKLLMALITKQRMMDNGIGLDLVSLSQPPLHTVPLFHVECKEYGVRDFYETPHWVNLSYLFKDAKNTAARKKNEPTMYPFQSNSTAKTYHRSSGLSQLEEVLNEISSSSVAAVDDDDFIALPFADAIIGSSNRFLKYAHSLPKTLQTILNKNYYSLSSSSSSSANGTIALQSSYLHRKVEYIHETLNFSCDSSENMPFLPTPVLRPWGYIDFSNSSVMVGNNTSEHTFSDVAVEDLDGTLSRSFYVLPVLPQNDASSYQAMSLGSEHYLGTSSSYKQKSNHGLQSLYSYINQTATGGAAAASNRNESDPVYLISQSKTGVDRSSSVAAAAAMAAYDASVFTFNKRRTPSTSTVLSLQSSKRLLSNDSIQDTSTHVSRSGTMQIGANKKPISAKPTTVIFATGESFGSPTAFKDRCSPVSKDRVGPSSSIDASSSISNTNGSTHLSDMDRDRDSSKRTVDTEAMRKTHDLKKLVEKYASNNRVNPFVKEEGESRNQRATHNRRRWSHVFLSGKLERGSSYGLNWKSLCQPAILPLTTGYIASVANLQDRYHIQGDYDLILDNNVCAFDSAENLLKEMICQRLSQEYQLVEMTDKEESFQLYKKYINMNGHSSIYRSKKKEKEGEGELFYILSMGHRIQFLSYDPSLHQVRVTRLLWTGSSSTKVSSYHTGGVGVGVGTGGGSGNSQHGEIISNNATYAYELWVPQIKAFQTMKQTFNQFPTPEYSWNTADEILLGNIELDTTYDNVKAKRLRFAVLPDIVNSESDVETYFAKLDKVMQHIGKYCSGNDFLIDVMKDYTVDSQAQRTLSESTPTSTSKGNNSNTVKIWFQPQGVNRHSNPKWAFFKYDASASMRRVFRLELHWLACDSWLMEEFVNVLLRRCTNWSLRMAQIPEFFSTANLQVHPYRAQPYISVPSTIFNLYMQQLGHWRSPVCMVERLLFVGLFNEWIEDYEAYTNWEELGLPVPADYLPCNDVIAGFGSRSVTQPYGILPKETSLNKPLGELSKYFNFSRSADDLQANAESRQSMESARRRRKKSDRQYMHRKGYACVRVGATGFVWLLNSSGRVSDANAVNNRDDAITKLHEVKLFCKQVGIVYDILIEVIEDFVISRISSDS